MIASPPEETITDTEEHRSSRFQSKYAEASRLQTMMAAPSGRFESGMHEQWSGDLPIRCVSCGSVHLYGHGGEKHCQHCQTLLPIDQCVSITKSHFVLSLEGDFVRADDAWEKITVSKSADASGLGWIHRIDPSFFVVLNERWSLLSRVGGELNAEVSLLTALGSHRKASLRLVNARTHLEGELSLPEEANQPVIEKPAKRTSFVSLLWAGFAGLVVIGAMSVTWTVAPSTRLDGAIPISAEEEARASLYSTTSLDSAVSLVEQFHAASTVDEKSRFILPFASMKRDLGFHYAVNGNEPSAIAEFTKRGFHRCGDRLFCAIQGRYDNSEAFLAMVELNENQPMRLDWHAFSGTGDVPWRDFLTNTPTHDVSMRLLAKPDDFFAYGFEDNGEYACYRLTDIEGKVLCYGYVQRRSEAGRTLSDLFGSKLDTRAMHGPLQASIASRRPVESTPKRVTLKVGAKPGMASRAGEVVQVLIHDLVHVDWVGPEAEAAELYGLAMSKG